MLKWRVAKIWPKIFEILVSTDVRQLMCRISEDGACSACVAINVDECRSLDAIVPLPTDREGGISLVDVDRFGVAIPGQSCASWPEGSSSHASPDLLENRMS
jgi:hypothetical protein